MESPSRHLLFHGVVVLLVGLLAGVPYGRAIVGGRSEAEVRGWRVAHGALCMGATTMLAVAAVLSALAVGSSLKWAVSAAFIASGYGFCLALPYGAAVGHRGLSAAVPLSNRLVFAGNLLGAAGSLIGTLALLYAGLVSL